MTLEGIKCCLTIQYLGYIQKVKEIHKTDWDSDDGDDFRNS